MWNILTTTDLLKRLSEREKNALNTAGTDISQDEVLEDVARLVADEWRGKIGMFNIVDIRPMALPSELSIHILADFRYRAFTRLPSMSNLLDELRVKEWDRAMHVLDNLDEVLIEEPEDEYLPNNRDDGVPIIHVPWSPMG